MSTTVQRFLIVAVLLVAVVLTIRTVASPPPQSATPNPPEGAAGDATPIDVTDLRLPQEIAGLFNQGEQRAPDPNASWVPVGEFNGSEAGQTPPFELNGNLTRVRYQIDSELPFLTVFFVSATQQTASPFPDVIATNQTEGEVTVSKPAGSYYLTVQTIGGTWNVAVDEERAAL
jgi:hypothetical protein